MYPTDMLAKTPTVSSITNRINRFLGSPQYVLVVMLLSAVANILSLELFAYSIFTLLVLYTCFLGEDLLPIMPLFVFSYIIPSKENNPGRNDTTIFSLEHGGIYIGCLAVLIIVGIVYRVIRDRHTFFGRKYRLLPGMLLLTVAYMIGGLGRVDSFTQLKSVLFGLLQGCTILLPYFLFSGGVNWKKVQKDYFPWLGVCVGCLLLLELAWVYLSSDIIKDGVILRLGIYTGWGICNNIGGLLIMMIPFAFCLAANHRRGWVGAVIGSIFLVGTLFTCSRNAILTGFAVFLISVILTLYYGQDRKGPSIAVIFCIGIVMLLTIAFHKQLLQLFSIIIQKGFSFSTRDTIYEEGMKLFFQSPLFGTSFYSPGYIPFDWSESEIFSNFFPPRWHNTFVQLAACCGIVGVGAYVFHRVQTVCLLLLQRTPERVFVACSVLALIVSSLFDCHFFNIGPVLFYSIALAFAENHDI